MELPNSPKNLYYNNTGHMDGFPTHNIEFMQKSQKSFDHHNCDIDDLLSDDNNRETM